MPKSTNLSLVETEKTKEVGTAGEQEQEEVSTPELSLQQLITQTVNAVLNDHLIRIEARLACLEQAAHTDHAISLGAIEIAAIGNAIKGQTQQHLFDLLQKHYGMTPPAIRGDES